MNWYPWIVLLHVIGAFGFILAHGVSAFVAFRLRSEREPVRVAAMMDVSTTSLALLYVSLLVLLVAGIAAGLVGGHFSRLWIWIALAVLVAVMIAMYMIATPTTSASARRSAPSSARRPSRDMLPRPWPRPRSWR